MPSQENIGYVQNRPFFFEKNVNKCLKVRNKP